jgi:hypothetical protein
MVGLIVFFFVTFRFAIQATNAIPWDGAQPTTPISSPSWNPHPTPTPVLRRQVTAGNTICGYVTGNRGKLSQPINYIPPNKSANMISCVDTVSSICSPIKQFSILGCCDASGVCAVQTDCINSYEYSALCKAGCAAVPQTLTWWVKNEVSVRGSGANNYPTVPTQNYPIAHDGPMAHIASMDAGHSRP